MSFYQHHVFVCTNKRPDGHERGCCIDRGDPAVREYLKKRCKELGLEGVRINGAGCLDRCELGPVIVIYPSGEWLRCATKDEAEVIALYLSGKQDTAIDALRLHDDK